MSQDIPTILSLAIFFDGLTDPELKLVAAICTPAAYPQGHILFEENDKSDELYVISSGSIQVLMSPAVVSEQLENNEPIIVTELVSGQALGEIALVDQGMRSATARINEDNTHVLRIPRDQLMQLCNEHPALGLKIIKNLAADLAFKMRISDLTIRQYQSMLKKDPSGANPKI